MRTTLTLDPDVSHLLEEEAHRLRKPFKQVVNDALRRGLAAVAPAVGRYRVLAHDGRLRAGIDGGSLNRLIDELDSEGPPAKRRKRSS